MQVTKKYFYLPVSMKCYCFSLHYFHRIGTRSYKSGSLVEFQHWRLTLAQKRKLTRNLVFKVYGVKKYNNKK